MKLVHGQVYSVSFVAEIRVFDPCFFPQCSIGFHGPYLELIERLLPMMPDPSLDSFYFWNSGSEAVEGAIKMARYITGRQNIIAMQGQWFYCHPCMLLFMYCA